MCVVLVSFCFLSVSVGRLTSAEETGLKFITSVKENKQPGFFIGNVATGSDVFQNTTPEEKQNARFNYLRDTDYNKYFVLNDVTGNLNTSSTVIDREIVCEFLTTCILTFDVAVTSGKFFAIVTASVEIIDVNDNSPKFSYVDNSLTVNENEPIGTEFRIGSASDADLLEKYSIQSFRLEHSTDVFSLDTKAENDKVYSLSLILVQQLDREVKSSLSVKVTAVDGGDPARTGTLFITVLVADENDNHPAFSSNIYNVTINENIPQNAMIKQLKASDKDIGENGRISYRIRERQPNVDTIKRLFRLNEDSGELSVISELTKEPSEYYEFIVEAIDHGDVPLMNQTTVRITVNDVENYPPTIEVNLLSPGNIGFVDIEENQPTEVFVAHVNVEDYDKGENGQFSCDIANELFTLEKFPGRGFKVVVDGLLNREDTNMHNVTVVCQDHGTPAKTASETFFVRVLDVNDNDPVFDKDVYTENMEENNAINDKIIQVKATDIDLGLNGTVEYKLADNQDKFRINNNTGVVYANKVFDRESEGLVVFRVLAIDHGTSRRTGTTTVSLTLIDKNDNAPIMVPARPELRIAENLPANTSVGLLFAKDKDMGVNAMFTFSLAQVETTFPFTLSPNGDIRTNEELDREDKNRYEIPITVTDMGSTALSNTQYITIYVTDVNDNAPKVTFPNDVNDTVKFVYPPLDGYNVVTTIAAYDADAGENGSLTYEIVGGNEFGIFDIDPELGEISVKKLVNIHEDLTIALLVEVKDKAKNPKSTKVTLKVQLVFANATNAAPVADDVGNKYVIISVVVIVTTVAVAVAIVGVILFLRSTDNKKHQEDGSAGYSDSGISSNTDSLPAEGDGNTNGEEKLKKKKEVSFSLEFSLDGLDGGRNVETNTEEYTQQNRYYDKAPVSERHGPPMFNEQNQEKIDRHMKALKLQQYLWEAKSRVWENSTAHQLPVGDSESETSRETITCDSGRGGSEDDVSMSSPSGNDDKRFFSPNQDAKGKHVQFIHPPKYGSNTTLPTVRESTPIHSKPPPRPAPYRQSARDLPSNSQQILHPRLAIKTFQNPTYSANNSHNSTMSRSISNSEPWVDYFHQNGGKNYPRMRTDSGSSFRSNDDDVCSTTTSGSYTLDNDLNLVDMYPNQRDLVV